MLSKNNTLEYNYKILSQERTKQKISQENAATQITLSVSQIKSLENNLDKGFVNANFKKLALKRYAEFLGIDFYKVIFQPVSHPEKIINSVAEEPVVEVGNRSRYKDMLQLLALKKNKVLLIIGLLTLVFVFTRTDNLDLKTSSPEIITSNLKIPEKIYVPNDIENLPPVSNNFIANEKIGSISKKNIQEIENISSTVSIEFLCSIKSAPMDKIWSRVNPEKPATYFHIVSLKKQSICTIDNQGIFKQYDLVEGGKITHRGEAPFKVQLNPSISELYFQGWKVYLEENDTFIQLNPVDIATELN